MQYGHCHGSGNSQSDERFLARGQRAILEYRTVIRMYLLHSSGDIAPNAIAGEVGQARRIVIVSMLHPFKSIIKTMTIIRYSLIRKQPHGITCVGGIALHNTGGFAKPEVRKPDGIAPFA
jgi:hypothetical protein